MTASEKNRLAGIFLMVHGGLQAVAMVLMGLIYGGIGAAMLIGGSKGEEQFVGLVFIGVIVFLLIFSLIFIVPQVIGGWKLLKEKPNARIWGIIGSIVSCLSFPLGTAAGVFGLVFLFGEDGTRFYLNRDGREFQPSYHQPPLPPNSWQ